MTERPLSLSTYALRSTPTDTWTLLVLDLRWQNCAINQAVALFRISSWIARVHCDTLSARDFQSARRSIPSWSSCTSCNLALSRRLAAEVGLLRMIRKCRVRNHCQTRACSVPGGRLSSRVAPVSSSLTNCFVLLFNTSFCLAKYVTSELLIFADDCDNKMVFKKWQQSCSSVESNVKTFCPKTLPDDVDMHVVRLGRVRNRV